MLIYTWSQTSTEIFIQVRNLSVEPEIFISGSFIRITDTKQKVALALDLLHEINYKDEFTPNIRFRLHQLEIEVRKATKQLWADLIVKHVINCDKAKNISRRESSIREAELYEASRTAAKQHAKESLSMRCNDRLLTMYKKSAKDLSDKKDRDLLQVQNELLSISCESLPAKAVFEPRCPVRGTDGKVIG
jgi:hypothetical protein